VLQELPDVLNRGHSGEKGGSGTNAMLADTGNFAETCYLALSSSTTA